MWGTTMKTYRTLDQLKARMRAVKQQIEALQEERVALEADWNVLEQAQKQPSMAGYRQPKKRQPQRV